MRCAGTVLHEGAAELHAVAAFIGGIASQEVIKVGADLITISQFFPKKNDYVSVQALNNKPVLLCS